MRQFLVSVIVVVGLFIVGCERSDSSGGGSAGGGSAGGTATTKSSGKKITVAMLPKKKGIPYFTTCAAGAEEAAKELGNVTLIYDGPTDGSPEKAASMIETWMLQGVDVIAVSPNDPKVLAPAMKKAQESGVKVITWDADGDADTRSFFVNQAMPSPRTSPRRTGSPRPAMRKAKSPSSPPHSPPRTRTRGWST
jgi:rhamnose transport system substrate-binding protein